MSSTVIKNVRIFDGEKLREETTLVIENGLISDGIQGDISIDGSGCTLLPGLIDAHVHVDVEEHLKNASVCGITTMFEMANKSPKVFDKLRNKGGLTNLIGCCYPATAENKMAFPSGAVVKDDRDAERYVNEVVSLGADFIKIIIEDPSKHPLTGIAPKVFTLDTIMAIVKAAYSHEKLTVAHVTTPSSYQIALDAGVDILTHTPLVPVLLPSIINQMASNKTICIPTMVMMKGIYDRIKKMNPAAPVDINNVIQSVREMHKEGITILAGTDANDEKQSPCQFPHGASLIDELELLVSAGLSTSEAINSATKIPARIFGLKDRGEIATGKRADLILVKGNPLEDINALRAVQKVWIEGVPVEL